MQKLFDRAELARLHAQVAGLTTDVSALLSAAETALDEERFADAETLLRGALIAAPDRAAAWHGLGRLAEAGGDIDHAEEAYRRAMALDEDEQVALDLARLLASSGQFDESHSLATWLGLQATSSPIRRAAAALAVLIERREAHHAAR